MDSTTPVLSTGLTTGQSPFIEQARAGGTLYIDQPYHLYSQENHQTWRRLYARMIPFWNRFANTRFQEGLATLSLDPDRVPRLAEVNRFLAPRTGFRAKAVSGYVPAFLFFDCLRNREFPTTITIRDHERLDYLPEPDIFHDIAGHVPLHTDPAFAASLVRFGDCAHTAAELASRKVDQLASIIRAMARFFWFTVEFGLIRESNSLKACGSGLLSSHGELEYALTSPKVQRSKISLEWVIHQAFEIDHYQPLLFILEDFEQLFDLVGKLEEWMRAGKLDQVAPGEPSVSSADLRSFLQASL